jgi:hypothetical protein
MSVRKVFTFTLVVMAGLGTALSAQSVYTPDKGSPERKAILDALRVPVERDLKQKIVFVASDFKVSGNWAFVGGEPTTPKGERPSLKGTAWEGEEDLFDDNFFGLLRKRGGKWSVVAYALGCTDVCYADWWRRYRAPKTIFPHTE